MFPLIPESLCNRAYRLSFMGTACLSLYSLWVALLPNVCRSLEHTAKFTRRNFGRSALYR
ncbi:hypothetical protein HanHA300_Chr02g0065961 [Helianthus annuus]|nr:hypothetical protein HanHA300_Chr02g0065961 [Helianthus annuus]KAJ0778171.1 hypothetical protein HanLR1_Chr02g0068761 [Helianthus annuus]KAJ0952814.1 hypothetical protein HanPSC8_Chr02g0076671 [Helianthus annuus]